MIAEDVTVTCGGVEAVKNVTMKFKEKSVTALIGPSGCGKTTFLRTLMGELAPDSGEVKWSENHNIGYYAQDHAHEFEEDMNLFDWMSQWRREGDDEQAIRGFLGRMLFSARY